MTKKQTVSALRLIVSGLKKDKIYTMGASFLPIFENAIDMLKDKKPKLMTVEELEALPVGAVVWEEYLDAELGIMKAELDPVMKTEDGNLIGTNGYTTIMEGMGDPDVDGNAWRWWSSRPTAEQRKAVKWDVHG